jgi:hypothetical protein
MASKSLRPSNRVTNGANLGTVLRVGKRKQGGAWCPVYVVRLDNTDAVRRIRSCHVRPALV